MKTNKYTLKFIAPIFLLLTTVVGCDDSVLEIENPNDPTFAEVYKTPQDVETVAAGLYNTIYQGTHSYSGVEMMLATAADHVSCSWGNQAMRDMSWEPRNFAWLNTPSYSYRATTKYFFDRMYAALNSSIDVINAMEKNGIDMGEAGNARARAMAKFTQGVTLGNLAMVFDKTFLKDESIVIEGKPEFLSDYKIVSAAAVGYLEEAIAASNATTFTIPTSWLGTEFELTSAQFAQLCNTYAARILSYTPRNNAELQQVDWNKVKTFADAGITFDFNVVNDAYVRWYAEAGDYLTFNGWGVTDMYVVHLMDPTQPQHWDDDPAFAHPPESTNPVDDRMTTDFDYLNSNWFQAARGYYHYSNYRSKRYDALYVNADGPKPEVLQAENDLLRAEARIYSGGSLSEAADIINASTRVTRGGMDPVAAVKEDLIKAIHHERHVELYTTGMGVQFFEMRKLDLLQTGTPLHLPLPAELLQLMPEIPQPYYTFGTEAQADGVNTSNGGWR